MKREYFTFYRVFWDVAKQFQPTETAMLLRAVIEYGLYRTRPNLPPTLAQAFFAECHPTLERDWQRYERRQAKKGGAR